eukprot:bmy_02165T0
MGQYSPQLYFFIHPGMMRQKQTRGFMEKGAHDPSESCPALIDLTKDGSMDGRGIAAWSSAEKDCGAASIHFSSYADDVIPYEISPAFHISSTYTPAYPKPKSFKNWKKNIEFNPRKKRGKVEVRPINLGTDYEYGVLNIHLTAYDVALAESYAQYVHNLCNHLSIKVEESYVMPTKTVEALQLQDQGSKMLLDSVLTTRERVVQISGLSATFAEIFLEIIQSNLPEGVKLTLDQFCSFDLKYSELVSIIELQREHYFSDYALLSTLIDAATLFGLRESQQSKLGRKKEATSSSSGRLLIEPLLPWHLV